MNKEQLKKTLKPLIKECIKEVIFEEGVLSGIISEVVKGTGQVMTEEKRSNQTYKSQSYKKMHKEDHEKRSKQLKENRKRLLDSIGRDAYGGVDLFEGTQPLSVRESQGSTGGGSAPHGSRPLDGIDPRDPGVDLGALGFNIGSWKH